VKTRLVKYFGQTIALPDFPEYDKFYRKLEAGKWEPNTFRTLHEYLDEATVFIDIGGWIGVTALWASRFAKRVIVVEPDPRCAEILSLLCAGRSDIIVLEQAFSDEPSVILHEIDGFGSSETTPLDIAVGEQRIAPGVTAGTIVSHARGEKIFVKIDIEGYEYRIGAEIAKFANYDLRGLQCALHPQLYERSIPGNRLSRRLKTFIATANLAHLRPDLFAVPPRAKYASMLSYLLFGVLFRAVPKGTDLLFAPRNRKSCP
jgi:FkbM family methyltransferase